MRLVSGNATRDAVLTLGITEGDFDFVCGDVPWTVRDRGRVRNVLDALCHGTVDVMGIPRIRVPAEFRAATLVTFVDPVNLMPACIWCESDPAAEDLADGGSMDTVSGERLFGLVVMLAGDKPEGEPRFDKRVSRALREAEDGDE